MVRSTLVKFLYPLLDKRQGVARLAGAACSAYAVDIIFVRVRFVVVDDVRDVVDVEAAGCDVGRHEDLGFVVLEGFEGALPL